MLKQCIAAVAIAAAVGSAGSALAAEPLEDGLTDYDRGNIGDTRWLPTGSMAGSFHDGVIAYGRGDYATALKLMRPLADQGYLRAQYNLGVMYAKGEGVARDHAAAVTWYGRAADQGHAGAQFSLGVLFAKGLGVAQDHAAAVKWYSLAAGQGLAAARTNLGVMYERGTGVPQDNVLAYQSFGLAAAQDHAGAQNNLGMMYADGRGVEKDDVLALMWLTLAAERGVDEAITNSEIVAERMSPDQVAEAQRRASEWKALRPW